MKQGRGIISVAVKKQTPAGINLSLSIALLSTQEHLATIPHHALPPPPQGLCHRGLTAPQAESRPVVFVVVFVVRKRPSLVRRDQQILRDVSRQASRRRSPDLHPEEGAVEIPGVDLRPHQVPVHAAPRTEVRRLAKVVVGWCLAHVGDEDGLPGWVGEGRGHGDCEVVVVVCWQEV
jgi:hypothetical protein